MEERLQKLMEEKQKELAEKKQHFPLEQIFHKIEPRKDLPGQIFAEKEDFLLIPELFSHNLFQNNKQRNTLSPLTKSYQGCSISNTKLQLRDTTCPVRETLEEYHGILLFNDLILEPFQIFEARYFGFDVVELKAEILTPNELLELFLLSREYGMECLLSVTTKKGLEKALSTPARLIGVHLSDHWLGELSTDELGKLMEYIPRDKVVLTRCNSNKKDMIQSIQDEESDGAIFPV
jgi:indole-3-glycerol phosphate synthase